MSYAIIGFGNIGQALAKASSGSAALSSEDSIEYLMQPLRMALADAMRTPKR